MFKRILIGSLLAVAPALSLAQDEGFYLGAKGGLYTIDADELKINDAMLGVFGGYRINPYVAIEAEYMNLFKGSDNIGIGRVSLDADIYAASIVPTLPLSEAWELFGKIGYARIEANGRGSIGGGTIIRESGKDNDWLFGLGAQYKVNALQIRGEVQTSTDVPDFMIYSIGIGYRF